jgi:hypothetical protein
LTGIAAIITSVTGFIIAYNSLSHSGRVEEPKRESGTGSETKAASNTPAKDSSAAVVSAAVQLPQVHRVKLSSGTAAYTIVSAEIEPLDAERQSLKFAIRYLNAGRYPSNFWSDSFRLIVNDIPRAPTNSLNEVAPADSGKDGEVIFEVPAGARDVVLQITAGDEKSRLSFKLP